MQRATNYSMDLNEITNGSQDSPLLEYDMFCPQTSTTEDKYKKNWSSKQCELRVRIGARCIRSCAIGQKIKKRLEESGELEILRGIDEMAEEIIEEKIIVNKARVGKHKNPKKKAGPWGAEDLIERNVELVTDILNGRNVFESGTYYGITVTRIRQIVMQYCYAANKRAFNEERVVNLEYLIKKKERFIKYFPKKEEK